MKIFKYIGLFILMVIALVINAIEAVIIVVSFPIRGIDYVLHIVFKKISEWALIALKRFNVVSVYRRKDE